MVVKYSRFIIFRPHRSWTFCKAARRCGKHTRTFKSKNHGFFGVNLTARKPEKSTPETNVYVRKFLQRITWQPTISAVFAGALLYPRYTFLVV